MRSIVCGVVVVCASCVDVGVGFDAPFHDVVRGSVGATASPAAWARQPSGPHAALPPISGGTLWVSKDGTTLVAADPENDVIWFTDIGAQNIRKLELQLGDEPGRVVEDAAQRVHVVLRGAGDIATVSLGATPTLTQRRHVCDEPRGIAYEAQGDTLIIACADGLLLNMPAASGDAVFMQQLPDDLRDVALSGSDLYVSRFRSAEILKVDGFGTVTTTVLASTFSFNGMVPGPALPHVAWRMVALPSGGVAVVHQNHSGMPIDIQHGFPDAGGFGGNVYGGGGCGGVVTSTVSVLKPGLPETTATVFGALPVDIAASSNDWVGVVSAGNSALANAPLSSLTGGGFDGGFPDGGFIMNGPCGGPSVMGGFPEQGQPVALAYLPNQTLVVQLRSPAGLAIGLNPPVQFPIDQRDDVGHRLFHTQTPSGLACASCHPDGRDDGHVWQFIPDGPRRTQNLTGGLLETAPFHWDGAFDNMSALMDEVLVGRMGAPSPSPSDRVALEQWLNSVKRPVARLPADAVAAGRGKVLFESVQVGCTACHSGPRFTSNVTVDVGTGRAFQVPSLTGLAARAPYLHDGCAQTLEDRFVCGGGDLHGHTSDLSPGELSDLVAYLKTL